MDWILLCIPIGALMLYFGSEWMVRGAKGLALRLGVSPLVIGLTVVAFGTSSPEFVTSLVSGETPELIVGNIVGSNIANVFLALGLTVAVAAIPVDYASVRTEALAFILSGAALVLLALDGSLGFSDGIVLMVSLAVVLLFTYRTRKVGAADAADDCEGQLGYPRLSALVLTGILLLYFGARMFVDGARSLAEDLGVSDMYIGLLVVALGTCLPETFISVVAARRGETGMAVANIFGSVIFNTFLALGAGSLLTDIPVSDSMLTFHLPVMFLAMLMMFLTVRLRRSIPRWSGPVLVFLYLLYLAAMQAWPALTV